ncbi:MAG: hypothetical protein BJ554DRAFT_552 [Olpidium bornovanus]|uniref:Uncharacterized protein n=1 Tax=Olpidium bornovanus TaxID=278681 RepID=A0A8H8DHS2_9FUNG|nr:MAG: hypothetical protein BJ554DRAFT_552 [Olpidium bornovanus]
MATAARQAQAPAGPGKLYQFKLVLLGESALVRLAYQPSLTFPLLPARRSLVLRFVKDQFDDYRESTIGGWCAAANAKAHGGCGATGVETLKWQPAFLTQTVALDDSTTERYKSLAPMYYRNANCAVVVYDITQTVDYSQTRPPNKTGPGPNFFFHLHPPSDVSPSVGFLCQASLDKAKSWVKELQRQADPNIVIALAGNKCDLEARRAVPIEVGATPALSPENFPSQGNSGAFPRNCRRRLFSPFCFFLCTRTPHACFPFWRTRKRRRTPRRRGSCFSRPPQRAERTSASSSPP